MFTVIKRRLGSAALVTYVLVTVTLAACDDSAKGRALGLVRRTIPTGDSMPSLADAVRNGQSISYVWDVETPMSPNAYGAWLREQLTDFDVVESDLPRLRFAKLVGGDAYRLYLTIERGTAADTHVHGQLIVSPD